MVSLMPKSKTYFELKYQGPWTGVDVATPESDLNPAATRSMQNFILKYGQIRTRPRISLGLPPTPDNKVMTLITSFMDSNEVSHTVADTPTGLWQLNGQWKKYLNTRGTQNKAWSLIGAYPNPPGPGLPDATVTFTNRIYWTNGGNNLWSWDGISSVGKPSLWPKQTQVYVNFRIIGSDGNVHIVTTSGKTGATQPVWAAGGPGTQDNDGTAVWTNNGKPAPANGFDSVGVVDATNGITAGAYFLGELNSQLIMLSTLEGPGNSFSAFPQRIRWCPSGIPNIWDPNVNLGAGFSDELDVPDSIMGFLTIGRTGFIFRTNGITEMTTGNSGINPWVFNHLWASDRGIGNVFPFSIAGYGPIGIFASADDFYNISLGGFEGIGGNSLDAIFGDIAQSQFQPIASIVPYFTQNYIYPVYKLDIPLGNGCKSWVYSIKDKVWQSWFKEFGQFSGRMRFCING